MVAPLLRIQQSMDSLCPGPYGSGTSYNQSTAHINLHISWIICLATLVCCVFNVPITVSMLSFCLLSSSSSHFLFRGLRPIQSDLLGIISCRTEQLLIRALECFGFELTQSRFIDSLECLFLNPCYGFCSFVYYFLTAAFN